MSTPHSADSSLHPDMLSRVSFLELDPANSRSVLNIIIRVSFDRWVFPMQTNPVLPTFTVLVRKTHERFAKTLFTGAKHNMRTFGVIPFIKLQNDT